MDESSSARKPCSRVHRPMYGFVGTCACIPTSDSIASAADISKRCKSICRASRARLSARRLSTSAPMADTPRDTWIVDDEAMAIEGQVRPEAAVGVLVADVTYLSVRM